MSRGGSSFDRILGRQPGSNSVRQEGEPPSVHELFAMTMRDELPLPQFMQALVQLHNVRVTPAAARLLSSVDASSGRLSFAQFQKALQDDPDNSREAGRPVQIQDQAHAIISDNSGSALAPEPRGSAGKQMTDISKDDFVKAGQRIGKIQARGPFTGGIVRNSNETSNGNPLAARDETGYASMPGDDAGEDAYGVREMSATATRMFVSGEMGREDYEKFLARLGIVPGPESDLVKLIVSHDRAGDGSFTALSRAVTAELSRAGGS